MSFIVYNHYYDHQVDEKRRIMIPSQWRRKSEGEVFTMILWQKYVSKDEDLCLMMIPETRMESVIKKLMEEKISKPEVEALKALIGYYSIQVEMDKAGRIIIPKDFAEQAGLTNEAKLVGYIDMFAIWNPERFMRIMTQMREKAPEAYGLI